MNVLIRCDASFTIGTGHVARCLTLADALVSFGVVISFVCRDLPGNRISQIEKRGYGVFALPTEDTEPSSDQAAEAAVDWQADQTAVVAAIGSETVWDWLIVDHYGLDTKWEAAMRPHVRRIAVIDDLANRRHDADLLIDHNLTAQDAAYAPLSTPHCRRLLGPKYALISTRFAIEPIAIREQARRVLLNFGGADARGLTLKAALALDALPDLQLDIVSGAANPDGLALAEVVSRNPAWRLYDFVEDFAALMGQADIAISAGGGTTWERAALGIPTICLSVAPNQVANAETLAKYGVHLYLGDAESVTGAALRSAVSLLLSNIGLRHHFSHASRQLVDGRGAVRVAARLAGVELRVYAATLDDARLLYEGRNDAMVRQWSRNGEAIAWDDHLAWLKSTLASPQRLLLIATINAKPIGVLRYDRLTDSPESAEVSIYLLAGQGGMGWGQLMLQAGEQAAQARWPALQRLVATVRPDNAASIRLFEQAAFVQIDCQFERVLGVIA